MLQFFRKVWQRLWGRLRYCGAVHYLAGGPSLPPPLTPEQEKALCQGSGSCRCSSRNPGRSVKIGFWLKYPEISKEKF